LRNSTGLRDKQKGRAWHSKRGLSYDSIADRLQQRLDGLDNGVGINFRGVEQLGGLADAALKPTLSAGQPRF